MPDSTEVTDFEPTEDSGFPPELPEQGEYQAATYRKSGWRKWLRRVAITCVVLAGLIVGGAFLLLKLAAVEPEFYKQALNVNSQTQQKYGSAMEAKLLDLRNAVLSSDSWSAEFSEDQINGWLAWDMQKKFPDLLPPEISDPRVQFGKQSAKLAFRCDVKPFRGVAVVEADIFMTGVVNQVGIRIKSIRSGMVPIPLAAFANRITEHATQSNLEIEWLTEEGDPVAIVDLPDSLVRFGAGDLLEVQKLEILDKQLRLGGMTHPADF